MINRLYAIPPDFQSPFDATVVHLLTASGATLVGKTNCDEFGMGYALPYDSSAYIHRLSFRSLNVHSVHGPVVNPYQHPSSTVEWHARERRSAGGSSGGSGAAVASGMCDA
jgi:aspartyl-tRNA(Asn)/glutamyl-tRNA(Gln) amidotransferase subunit A